MEESSNSVPEDSNDPEDNAARIIETEPSEGSNEILIEDGPPEESDVPIENDDIPKGPADVPKESGSIVKDVETLPVKPADLARYQVTPNDSNDPSYSNLVLPYRVVCRQRYRRAGAKQRAQFIKEIKEHELLQTKALDGVRIHREFCNAIISPPRAEEIIKPTKKQKMKIEAILRRPF